MASQMYTLHSFLLSVFCNICVCRIYILLYHLGGLIPLPISVVCFCLQDLIQSALQDIVSAEFRKLNESSQNEDTRSSTSVPEVNDMLWEYDDLESAYQGDCEDIMIEMQRIFYEDLSQNQLQEVRHG